MDLSKERKGKEMRQSCMIGAAMAMAEENANRRYSSQSHYDPDQSFYECMTAMYKYTALHEKIEEDKKRRELARWNSLSPKQREKEMRQKKYDEDWGYIKEDDTLDWDY